MLQARRDGRRLMRGKSGIRLIPFFTGLMLYVHLTISELPELVSLGLSIMGNSLFPGANVCVSLEALRSLLRSNPSRDIKTVRPTPVNLPPQLLPGSPVPLWHSRVHLCAFNSVLLLDCQVLEGQVFAVLPVESPNGT